MPDLDTEFKRRFAAGLPPPPGLTDDQKMRWAAGIYPFGPGEAPQQAALDVGSGPRMYKFQ